jgi:uncharacterized damage-inducible protein DinB
MTQRAQLELAVEQIKFARVYMLGLLDGLSDADWFAQPTEGITHIAWQVGHLAMAEYGLCMFRIRGRRTEDLALMSGRFRKQFSKGSTPNANPAENPAPEEIREVLDRVHNQALVELAELDDAALSDPIDEPYAVYPTKLGALFFCADHEMLHAGQIGLLRRLIGHAPVR